MYIFEILDLNSRKWRHIRRKSKKKGNGCKWMAYFKKFDSLLHPPPPHCTILAFFNYPSPSGMSALFQIPSILLTNVLTKKSGLYVTFNWWRNWLNEYPWERKWIKYMVKLAQLFEKGDWYGIVLLLTWGNALRNLEIDGNIGKAKLSK